MDTDKWKSVLVPIEVYKEIKALAQSSLSVRAMSRLAAATPPEGPVAPPIKLEGENTPKIGIPKLKEK